MYTEFYFSLLGVHLIWRANSSFRSRPVLRKQWNCWITVRLHFRYFEPRPFHNFRVGVHPKFFWSKNKIFHPPPTPTSQTSPTKNLWWGGGGATPPTHDVVRVTPSRKFYLRSVHGSWGTWSSPLTVFQQIEKSIKTVVGSLRCSRSAGCKIVSDV